MYFVKRIMNIGIFWKKFLEWLSLKILFFAWVIYRKDVEQVNNFRTVFYDDSFHMALHKTWAVFYDDSFDMALHKTRTVFT